MSVLTGALSRRVMGFGALPLLSALTPLVALPALARTCDTSQWATFLVGQSVGSVTALAIGGGWSVIGAPEVALSDGQEQVLLFRTSVLMRCILSLLILPLAFLVTAGLGHGDLLGMAATTSGAGLGWSLAWFAVGRADVRMLLWYDVAPRVFSNVLGAILAVLFESPVIYCFVVLGFQILPSVLLWRRLTVPRGGSLLRGLPERFLQNSHAAFVDVVAGASTLGSVALVGSAVTQQELARYGSFDRITRMASIGISATSNGLMSWVSTGAGYEFGRRVRASLMLQLATGGVGAVGLIVLGPALSEVLFGAQFQADRWMCAGFGVYFFFWALETVMGRQVLAARDHHSALLVATICGAAVGAGCTLFLAEVHGASAASWGLGAGMAVTVLIELPFVARIVRKESAAGALTA